MEIYVIGSKNDFNEDQIKRLQNLGDLFFIEEVKDKYNEKYITSNEEKILVINPDLIGWDLPNDLLEKIPNLKALCLMSTSYAYVDIEYCNSNGITVTNVPKYSTDSVAEYACFLMLAIARKLPLQMKNNFKEDFSEIYLRYSNKEQESRNYRAREHWYKNCRNIARNGNGNILLV